MGIAHTMNDALDDVPASQDAKTLVPLSLSLYVRHCVTLQ